MKIINPSYEILTNINEQDILKTIEMAARTCYKSEDKITEGSAEKLVSRLVKSGHHAMIEFFDITVKFIHSRGFTHELVRHRMCSFAQESTRYCNYSNERFGKQITIILPYWFNAVSADVQQEYIHVMNIDEAMYFKLIESGLPAQAARGVLPNDLKTEIVIKANVREWRHIFALRAAEGAHPDMRRIMVPLLNEFQLRWPTFFLNVGNADSI